MLTPRRTRATYAGIPFAFHVVVPTASFESKDFVQFVSTSPAVFPKCVSIPATAHGIR